jgi:D-amino-acid oxidase
VTDVDAIVVGAGVIGLTSAIRLAEAGLRTRVWTADEAAATTSYAAGASWGPHLVADAPEVTAWGLATLAVHRSLAAEDGTGVRIGTGVEASRGTITAPDWASDLDGVRMVGPDELPPGFASGWKHRTPIIDMPVHLAYLRRRYLDLGATIVTRRITSLADVDAPIVVNCTGIGARDVAGDATLTPIRGQVVICENPGITDFFVEDPGPVADLTYFFPHGDSVLLGGQALPGDYRREPDPTVAREIVARCAAVDPRLATARVIEHRVGLRPSRPSVRVSLEPVDGRTVIHNYGHGGSGVTLSWGCADEVVSLTAA